MEALSRFCNATTVNGSWASLLWRSGRLLDCGLLGVEVLCLLPLLVVVVAEATLWRRRRRAAVRWQTTAAAVRALSALASGALLTALAATGAYHRQQSTAATCGQVAGSLAWLGLGALAGWRPGRRRSLLLSAAWVPAAAALALAAVQAWLWLPPPAPPRFLATLAAAFQVPYALALAVELVQLAVRQARVRREESEVARLNSQCQGLWRGLGQVELGRAEDGHGCLSRLLFTWTHPLLRKGTLGQLESVQSLFQLPEAVEVEAVSASFAAARERQAGRRRFLLRCLFSAFGLEFLLLGFLKFTSNMLSFTGPVLLHSLVAFVGEKDAPLREGLLYAAALFSGTLLSAITSLHFSFRMTRVGLKVRSAIITAVYDKLLELSAADLNDSGFTQGELMNFMSTDTDRIVNFCPSFHGAWALPLQLAIALALLYREVGLAFLAGLGFAIVLVPVNRWITQRIGFLSTKMMHWKDKRVNV